LSTFASIHSDVSPLLEAYRSFGNYDLGSTLTNPIENGKSQDATKIAVDCFSEFDISLIRIEYWQCIREN